MKKLDAITYFSNPSTPDHKKYEALRAIFLEKLPKEEVSKKFGYTDYSLQAIIRDFKQGKLIFFPPKKPGPIERMTPKELRDKIVFLRKQNLSSEDIYNQLILKNIKIGQRLL